MQQQFGTIDAIRPNIANITKRKTKEKKRETGMSGPGQINAGRTTRTPMFISHWQLFSDRPVFFCSSIFTKTSFFICKTH